MTKNLCISKKWSIFAPSNKTNILFIMKKINYSRVFTQKLRENNVFGLFCEEASEELLSLLFNKKDFFSNLMILNNEKNAITEVAQMLKKQGKDMTGNIEKAYLDTKLIYKTLEQ